MGYTGTLIKSLKDDNKTFINVKKSKLKEENTNEVLNLALAEFKNSTGISKELQKIKLSAILKCIANAKQDITIRDIVNKINKEDSELNIAYQHIIKYRSTNELLCNTFYSNKKLFELMKEILLNGVFVPLSFYQRMNFLIKHGVFDNIDIDKCIEYIRENKSIDKILRSSNVKITCTVCNKEKPISEFRIAKMQCRECENRLTVKRRKTHEEYERYIEYKENEKISKNLDARVDNFKSNTGDSNQDSTITKEYLMCEAVYNTIERNIFDIDDINIENLSQEEKNKVMKLNNNVIAILNDINNKLGGNEQCHNLKILETCG